MNGKWFPKRYLIKILLLESERNSQDSTERKPTVNWDDCQRAGANISVKRIYIRQISLWKLFLISSHCGHANQDLVNKGYHTHRLIGRAKLHHHQHQQQSLRNNKTVTISGVPGMWRSWFCHTSVRTIENYSHTASSVTVEIYPG